METPSEKLEVKAYRCDGQPIAIEGFNQWLADRDIGQHVEFQGLSGNGNILNLSIFAQHEKVVEELQKGGLDFSPVENGNDPNLFNKILEISQ